MKNCLVLFKKKLHNSSVLSCVFSVINQTNYSSSSCLVFMFTTETVWNHRGVQQTWEDRDGRLERQDAQCPGGEDPRGVPGGGQSVWREDVRCAGSKVPGLWWQMSVDWECLLVYLGRPNRLLLSCVWQWICITTFSWKMQQSFIPDYYTLCVTKLAEMMRLICLSTFKSKPVCVRV